MRARDGASGFVISSEMLLIALVLTVGLITGWIKLRDQSLSELTDSIAAIDAYISGSAPLYQTGGTRWIATDPTCAAQSPSLPSPCIIGPSSTGAITESWDTTATPWPTAIETSPGVFEKKDGILLYGAPAAEAP